ncbi:Thiosulfate sulfurtransferase [archaeon HR06]|nr:Thiosulfate sulfurtransferase [archaeon HR06]
MRERLNYLEGHIPKAQNIPWKFFSGNKILFRDSKEILNLLKARNIRLEDEVITYCGGGGTLSGLAFYALKYVGLEKVRLYMKSFIEWKELNLPIEKVKDANYWDLAV